MTDPRPEIGGLPYGELRMGSGGGVIDFDTFPERVTDVIVLSHGWKNSDADARALYRELGLKVASCLEGRSDERTYGYLGILWPALRFLPPPGAVGGDDASPEASMAGNDLPPRDLLDFASAVGGELGMADPEQFGTTALAAVGGGKAADQLLAHLRATLTNGDPEAVAEHESLLKDSGSDLLEAAWTEPDLVEDVDEDADDDPSARFGNRLASLRGGFIGARAAVGRLLNQATYFEMKARAGLVGAGVADHLTAWVPSGSRVHLVGHSFGARLVASCAASSRRGFASLSLLQAAFSQFGLGRNVRGSGSDGAFRRIIGSRTVDGPIVVTHTLNDTALTAMYPLASALSLDPASSHGRRRPIGGPDAPFGALGANGAQAMAPGESVSIEHSGELIGLPRSKVANILADAFVLDHNDVTNAPIAALVASAVM